MASLPKRSGDGDILISMRANEYRSKKSPLWRMHITSTGVRLTTLALTMLWTQKALCINVLSETCQKNSVFNSLIKKQSFEYPTHPLTVWFFFHNLMHLTSCCCFWFGTVYKGGLGNCHRMRCRGDRRSIQFFHMINPFWQRRWWYCGRNAFWLEVRISLEDNSLTRIASFSIFGQP